MANVFKMKLSVLSLLLIVRELATLLVETNVGHVPCEPHDFGGYAIVCVCNATYCDTVEENTPLPTSQYSRYTSSKQGQRLEKTMGYFHTTLKYMTGVTLTIHPDTTYQTVLGFGGAVTDAAAINVAKLPPEAQELLISSYFGKNGIEYNVVRVNMGGCDFSTRVYSYDDHPGDFELTKFSLVEEDTHYKIPLIKYAQTLSNHSIRVFASPWSAPAWMKTNNLMYGKGSLRGHAGGRYHKTWAQYYVRFLQEYKARGVPLWGLTVLNEPSNGFITNFSFNCMGMTAEQERDFVVKDLGPALHSSGFSDVKLMIFDDQRAELPLWAQQVFEDSAARRYSSGIAVHWYLDSISSPSLLTKTHQLYPDQFILATEACNGHKPDLGNWGHGENYAHDIIQDLNHFVVGWTDWNIALDLHGGPNWALNFVDSPVIVDYDKGVFYKQPMFYVLGHFSKFVRPGCRRIDATPSEPTMVEYTAFLCQDNSVVVVLLNRQEKSINIAVRDQDLGDINVNMSAHSIHTVIWWR